MSGPITILPSDAAATLATDRVHVLIVPGVRFVGLRLFEHQWTELAGLECTLAIGGREIFAVADGEARVTFRIPAAAATGEGYLRVRSDAHGWAGGRGVALDELPDVSTPRGQKVRLDNLGYRPVGHDDPGEDVPSRWAIEEFQCEHGLDVDGECGGATQARLVEVHGH